MEVTKKAAEDEKEELEKEMIQFDSVSLFGGNRAMGAVVSVAELVKKCVPDLHQVTAVESITITDTYLPLEIGLKEVKVERPLVQLRITLSRNPKDVDQKEAGYQAPENLKQEMEIPTRKNPSVRGRGPRKG